MGLTEYKKKRSFSKTPEPEGKQKSSKGKLLFVIQKHQASHLHYDFRIELRGTLKSWAVPKGPSMNPKDKRLAMLVEDHPFDYKDFEGIIPEGNYGAGTVIIWDQGTYEPAEKFSSRAEQEKHLLKSFFSGSMRLKMHGKKLKGEFALVRSKDRGERSWLLIKKNDEFASDSDITAKDKSVVSGKNLEQVAASKSAKQWISNRSSNGQLKNTVQKNKSSRKKEAVSQDTNLDLKSLGAKKSRMLNDLKPMLATLVDEPFDEAGWIYEVKWDGYRALGYINNGKAELRSRNNNNFNEKFYPVYDALKSWEINAVVDGEIIVVNEKGLSEFHKLERWRSEADGQLVFYLFDILWLDGFNLMELPLIERRKILAGVIPDDHEMLKLSQNFDATGTAFFEVAEKLEIEGIIAKKMESPYVPDSRTKNWLKIKTGKIHEAVIAGFTHNEGGNKKFSALIVGVYKGKELIFIGQVGTGFTSKMQDDILAKLKPLIISKCPFPNEPVINKPTRYRPNPPKTKVTWVKPQLVCEVRYQELTQEGIMRHPSFQGMRSDKKAKDVTLEIPIESNEIIDEENKLQENKIVSAPAKRSRKTLLNPKDELQIRNINEHDLKFSNLSKIYWPKEKFTKRDMLNYYYRMAPYILPYMKDRPQSLNRYPNGINGESFYQKNVAGKVESWITKHRYENTSKDGEKTFMVCTDEASLLYMANLGCIEMNPWHSRTQSPDKPDWCVVDLDPDTNSFEQVIETAQVVKKVLDALDIPSFPKTSGSTGIHIYIPLGAKYTYEQSKQLAELIVNVVHDELPTFTSIVRPPSQRKGKIYLDFLQNRAIQTIAAPYSLRPKPGATASAPLHWHEVKKGLKMQQFNINSMEARLKKEGDIFKGVLGVGVDLQKVLKKFASVFK